MLKHQCIHKRKKINKGGFVRNSILIVLSLLFMFPLFAIVPPSCYHDNSEIKAALFHYAQTYPSIAKVDSIGITDNDHLSTLR